MIKVSKHRPACFIRLVLIMLVSLMCIALASSAMAQSDAPVRPQHGIALGELLDDHGKLSLPQDFSGSIDANGYVLLHQPAKATHFVQTDGLDGRQLREASSRSGCTGSFNISVNAMAAVAGELFVAGFFSDCDFEATANIARFDPATGEFSPLGDGVSSAVRALAVIGTDLYVGGEFIEVGDVIARNIAVYDTTQSGNAGWSPLGSGVNGTVRALAVIGSDLYLGGSFTAASGVIAPPISANSIIKYDTTQSDDAGWSALGSGTNTSVFELAVIGSDLYVGGGFSQAGGSVANRIAVYDTTQSGNAGWSALGSGVDGFVNTFAVIGSDLYIGGNFSQAGATAATAIAVYNTTQTGNAGWSALASGSNFELFENVETLSVIGTDLYVGGSFGEEGGVGLNIAVYDTTQTKDAGWSALGSGVNDTVLALQPIGTDLYVGGSFSQAGGMAANAIAVFDTNQSDDSGWSPLGNGLDTFTVGGTVMGLNGSGLVLQNNAGDDLMISANGPFTFVTALKDGSSYAVTVVSQPTDQLCTVMNGSGVVAGEAITNIEIRCALVSGIHILPEVLDFGDQPLGVTTAPQMAVVESIGPAELIIGSITLEGPQAADFQITMDSCNSSTLPVDDACGIEVVFTAGAPGVRQAWINIPSNAQDSPHRVNLIGTHDVLFADGFEQ